MKSSFRQLIWRELPPFVRRACVWCQRVLWHWELRFVRLYQSWKQSPAWNFVAIAGTTGIVLTILLFLTWPDSPTARLGAREQGWNADSATAKPWELDSRWDVAQTSASPAYLVELEFAPSAAVEVATQPAQRSRRRLTAEDLESRDVPANEPQSDWFVEERPEIIEEPPDLQWEVQIVRHRPPPVAEADVPEVELIARAEPAREDKNAEDIAILFADDWQACHRLLDANQESARPSVEEDSAVAAALESDIEEVSRAPLNFPESAPTSIELELDVAWNRSTRNEASRRRSSQLSVRNAGSQPIERVDVFIGPLAKEDLPDLRSTVLQTFEHLRPGRERSLQLSQRRNSSAQAYSVVTTAFVGSTTDITEEVPPPVASPRRPRPERLQQPLKPEPVRVSARPHLKLTAGNAERLRQHRLLSLPIRVQNDGNVDLENVVIVAQVPTTLAHRQGQTIHYRIGRMRAGAEHATIMLLTPLEAGVISLPLSVADEKRTAADTYDASLDVEAEDVVSDSKADSTERSAPKPSAENF